ncbi:hypothetical protein Tco_1506113 [Tanacetum coccineum]
MVVQNQSQIGKGSAIPTDPHHIPTFIQPSTQPQKTKKITRKLKIKDTQVVVQSKKPSGGILLIKQEVAEEVVEVINTAKLIIDATQVSAAGDIVSAATTVSADTTTTAIIDTIDDITLAQALKEMKSTKPKKKGIVIQELGESTTTISLQQSQNMEGYKLKDLKLKEFDSIQEMFDRAFKRVNTFYYIFKQSELRTELVKAKKKESGTELVQKRETKKQKVEDDKETTKLK